MTGKERVRAAVARQPVDRIPLGFYVVDCDTIARVLGRPTYVRDKIRSQIALWEGRRDEVVASYQRDTVEFYQKLDCADLIAFKEAPLVPPKGYQPTPPRQVDAETWEDRQGRVYKVSHLSNELVCVHDPNRKEAEDFTAEMFPPFDPAEYQPPDPTIFEACDYVIAHLGADRYIAGSSGGIVAFTLLGGTVPGLMLYATAPEVVCAANRRATAEANRADRDYIRPGQDAAFLEQDMAGTNGPLLSPAVFRETGLPFLKERIANLKQHGQQVLLHNCGDNRPLLRMFVEAGVDCYQSLQTTAGMEIGYLQEHYGHAMSFWGGVAVELLVAGTMEEVRQNVRQVLEIGKRRPGFILGPSHSIAYGTKYDNFMALLDEYHQHAQVN
jgi:hypothetical protein